jgi:hypothetical protein
MKLYHPDAITQDLMQRLDPPVRDEGQLTAELELPVQIKGNVVAHGAEMSLTGEIVYSSADRRAAESDIDLYGFNAEEVLYRPSLDELAELRERGSLRMPDLSIPEFEVDGLAALVGVQATFLGMDSVTDEPVAVAVMTSPYLTRIPDLAHQVPANLVEPDGWYDRSTDLDQFVATLAEQVSDEDEFDASEDREPVDPGRAEALRQAALRAQHTGQVGDQAEWDTPEAYGGQAPPEMPAQAYEDKAPVIPLRPSRAPVVLPGVSPEAAPTLAK